MEKIFSIFNKLEKKIFYLASNVNKNLTTINYRLFQNYSKKLYEQFYLKLNKKFSNKKQVKIKINTLIYNMNSKSRTVKFDLTKTYIKNKKSYLYWIYNSYSKYSYDSSGRTI